MGPEMILSCRFDDLDTGLGARESLSHLQRPKVGQELCQGCKILLLQTFPEISTLPWYTLLFPLSCLLLIRGLRDLIDDIVSEGMWPWGHCQGGALC